MNDADATAMPVPTHDNLTPALAKKCDSPDGGSRFGLPLALVIFLVSRAFVFFVAYTAPLHYEWPAQPESWPKNPLIRWDSGHYTRILADGYPLTSPIPETTAFFPAYSLLARPLAYWMSAHSALILVSNIAALVAVVVFYLWARRHCGDRIAVLAILLYCAYPPAFFLSTGYADAVLVMCAALVLWMLDRGWVLRAACVSALATATRPTGVTIAAIVVLWELGHGGEQRSLTHRARRLLLVGGLSIGGLLLHEAYLWYHYGAWDAYFQAQAAWVPRGKPSHPALKTLTLHVLRHGVILPLKYAVYGQFGRLLEGATWNPLWNVLILVFAAIGLVRPRGIPRIAFLIPIFIFLIAFLPDPAGGARLVGIARYQLVSFASFLLPACWLRSCRHKWVIGVLVLGLFFLQVFYIRGFADWKLVG